MKRIPLRPEPVAVVSLAVGMALLGLLFLSQRLWDKTIETSLPTLDTFAQVHTELTKAHLALEEVLAGDSEYTVENVWAHFEQARSILLGQVEVRLIFFAQTPMEKGRTAARIEDIIERFDGLVSLGRTRWETRLVSPNQHPEDRRFDRAFNSLLSDLNELEEASRSRMYADIERSRSFFTTLIVSGVVVLTLLVIVLQRIASRQREAQEEVERAERRIRDVVDQTGDWIWEVDAAGVYTFATPSVEPLLGYTPEQIVGKPFHHLFPDDARERQMESAQNVFLARSSFRGMLQEQTARSGDRLLFECSGVPLLDDDKTFRGFRGISRDVTSHYRAERNLTQTNRLLEVIRHAQQAYIADKGESATLETFLNEVLPLTDSHYGFVAEVTEEGNHLTATVRAFAEVGEDKRFALFAKAFEGKEVAFTNAETLIGAILLNGQPLIANDAPRDAKAGGLPPEHPPIHRFMGIPLVAGSRIVGVLGLANRKDEYRHEDVLFLEPALGTCANIIEAGRRERLRRQTEDQLALASTIFDNATEGVMITDERSVITSVNRAVTDITGFAEEDLLGSTPRLLRSDRHDTPFYRDMWRTIVEEGTWKGEVWNRRKSGDAYPQWMTITAIKDEAGQPRNYISVFHDLSQIKKSEEDLRYQADHDALTGLPNRLLFLDRLNQSLAWAHRTKGKMAVVFVAIDRFKKINESLGHLVGDLLLQEVGNRLADLLGEGDTLARWGSDEFTFILEYVEGGDATRFASRVIATLGPPFVIGEEELFVTASIGVSQYPASGADADSLVRTADLAVRRAKERGGNTFQTYTATLGNGFDSLTMERDMRKGLEREEFVVYYQPKVALATGRIVGMEALIRWRHPAQGLVSPATFIPLAEETGLIVPLGNYVLKEALAQTRRWIDAGYGELAVSVNLSALQFAEKNLFETISDSLQASGVLAANLEMEITESTVMRDVDAAIETLRQLSATGVKLSIDDFGTGYSSLAYLKRFPIDTLKIDRSFVRDIPRDQDDAVIAQAIISLAHSLGLSVVAEGVETVEQLEFLKEKGCDQMQGFLYSPPVPADRFEELLDAQPTTPGI